MPVQLKSGFTGLHTNIAESQMGPGALLGAENVVIRRPGAIEPRDGVQRAGTVSSGYAAWGFSWRTKDWILRNNGSNTFNWTDTAGGSYSYTDAELGSINPQPLRRDCFARAEARANLYVPYEGGTMKRDVDTGAWQPTGLAPMACIVEAHNLSTAGSWLGNNEHVAYRVVCKKVDANGVVIRSLTSGSYTAANTAGAGRAVEVFVQAVSTSTYDFVEVYRSANFPTSVTPSEEMQLVRTLPSASAAGSFVDLVLPANRGATLYTSPSRGGIANMNNRPPAAACVELYKGSLFFGNVRGPRTIKISANIPASSDPAADRSGQATGIGYRAYTGTITSGSANITGLSSTVGLEKGAVISSARFAHSWITNISGTTVTMSSTALSSSAGAESVIFTDAVRLGTTWVPVWSSFVSSSLGLVFGRWVVYSITPPESGYSKTFVIEKTQRLSTAQDIQATKGSEYSPPLPNFDAAALALSQDTWPGGIIWSKTDEPEHVAPGNYAYVGDVNKAILGLVPTRDALFILKEDGVFRLTGVAGEWRIDPVDPTTFCVLPSSVRAMYGKGYFLSQKGVLTISDNGLEQISWPVDDALKPIIDGVVSRKASSGFYELANVSGAATAAVYERENEYTLMTSDTGPAYVFNANTDAWTTWLYYKHGSETLPNRSLFNFERLSQVVYGLGTDYYTTLLSTSSVLSGVIAGPRFDRETSNTSSAWTPVTSTVNLSSAFALLADDILQDASGRLWRVVTAATANPVTVRLMGDTAGTAFATGTCIVYRALRTSVTIGFMEPSALQKFWGRITTTWSQLVGAVVLRHSFQSSQSASSVEEDTDVRKRVNGYTGHTYGYAGSWPVPNAHARAWSIRAATKVVQSHGSYRLEGIALATQPMEESSPPEVAP